MSSAARRNSPNRSVGSWGESGPPDESRGGYKTWRRPERQDVPPTVFSRKSLPRRGAPAVRIRGASGGPPDQIPTSKDSPIRLYYNCRNAPEGSWSIDSGDVSTEKNFRQISVRAYAPLVTRLNPDAVWPEPAGWLETPVGANTIELVDSDGDLALTVMSGGILG